MDRADKVFQSELRKEVNEVVKGIVRRIRARSRSQFGRRGVSFAAAQRGRRYRLSGALARSPYSRVRFTKRGIISSAIIYRRKLTAGKRGEKLPGAYAPALERGGLIKRRAGKSIDGKRRKAHVADFGPGRPWFEPEIKRSEADVIRVLNGAFKVIGG
jgi:hypothetical protein